MNTHPEHWYIQLTPENHEEVKAWWLKQVEKSGWVGRRLYNSYIILSKHPWDRSFYWSDGGFSFKKAFPSYQEITIEQFREITNSKPMNTLPTKWYIEVTKENQKELDRWRQQVATEYREYTLKVGHTLLSRHCRDNSCYHTGDANAVRSIEEYADYQEITIEQFRQITNSNNMNTLPTNWCIEATEENFAELYSWWRANASESFKVFAIGFTLMSSNPDGSCYFTNCEEQCVKSFPNYQPITIEQFRQITNSKPMTKTIKIPHSLLVEYYNAATTPQKEYMSKHFKLDGTTTDEAIRGLYELACSEWKPKIKANHHECFPVESKYFDFSKHTNAFGCDSIVSNSVADSLGLRRGFIQVRNSDTKNSDRSFYLHNDYNWELVKDAGAMVLIPTKKVK